MKRSPHQLARNEGAQVVDFDTFLFAARPAHEQSDLLHEARLLASVFAPDGDDATLQHMADQLSAGARDSEMGRAHARRLAAALKQLASAA